MGRGTGRATGVGTSVGTTTGTARGRGPAELALIDVIRENRLEAAVDTGVDEGRLDYDDFPESDLTPDLGQPDDDEPFVEERAERPPALLARPEIVLWEGPRGVEWEIRSTSATLLADPELARFAVRREQVLERYAEGLSREFLVPSRAAVPLSSATLVEVWDAIPIRNPDDPYDAVRWNTQAAIVRRWEVDGSTLSRDRVLLVALPNGDVVPFQFFTWKTENDVLVEGIAEAESLFTDSIRAVAEGVASQPGPQRTTKDLVPWVRAALRHPDIVRRSRDQFRSFPASFEVIIDRLRVSLTEAEAERARVEGGPPLGKQDRSLPVLHRALVGGL